MQTHFNLPCSKTRALLKLIPRKKNQNCCTFGQSRAAHLYSFPPPPLTGFNRPLLHNLLVTQEKQRHPLLQFHRKLQSLLVLEAPLHSPVQTHTDIPYLHTASDGGYGCMSFRKQERRLRIATISSFTSVLLLCSFWRGTINPLFHTVPLTANSALHIPLPPSSPTLLEQRFVKRFMFTYQDLQEKLSQL